MGYQGALHLGYRDFIILSNAAALLFCPIARDGILSRLIFAFVSRVDFWGINLYKIDGACIIRPFVVVVIKPNIN